MDKFLNLNLMRNPANWIILFLMVALAYVGAGYVAQSYANGEN